MYGEEAGGWMEEESQDLKRVKVYELIGSRWVDQGTAFCYGDLQETEAFLVARSETNQDQIILQTAIRAHDVYQRQQDTLIVWTEPDGVDYSLSFQDPDGCAEVWHFIQEVQRHLTIREEAGMSSSPLIGPEQFIATASIFRSGHLPQPQLGIIGDIERAIKSLARTNAIKERIVEYIQTEDYIKGLIDVMHQAEDLENIENLHALCSCMQTIFMLNDHSLYEYILEDDIFFGVIGMLEYDPEFPTHKANYREFLSQTAHFHQPIPLHDEAVQRKVHHTYRLQFLKDVVLARAIDDSTFNVLNSSILFNQIDIINYVQNDAAFFKDIMSAFSGVTNIAGLNVGSQDIPQGVEKMDVDQSEAKTNGIAQPNGTSSPKSSDEEMTRRREIISLIQQLCIMGKNIQLPARIHLFRTLVDRGILLLVQWALIQPETDEEGRQMIAAAGEILTTLVDHDVFGIRKHITVDQLGEINLAKEKGQKIGEKDTLLDAMCKVLVKSRDLAVQSQVGELLKGTLEVANDVPEQHPPGMQPGIKMLQRQKDIEVHEKFLEYFYEQCLGTIMRPFGDVPEFKALTDDSLTMSRERANLYLILCDLLSNFTLQHSFRSHYYLLSSNVAPRVASLLSARDKHLRLAAFRLFRACLKLNNNNIFKHLIKHDIFRSILDLTLRESRRDNLLSASCQEFFEYMRKENVKDVITHCMEHYESKIRELAATPFGGPRFQNLIHRHEMNMAPPPPENVEKPAPNTTRRWGQGSLLSAEEEDYFNADDDDEADLLPVHSSPPRGNSLKRKRYRGPNLSARGPRSAPLQPLSALVAYDDSDDLGGFGEGDTAAPLSPSIPRRPAAIPSGYFPTSERIPASPRITHKQITPKAVTSPPADEDDLLEQLFSSGPLSPSLSVDKPPELGVKRRREEDDDELLQRLASKGKRPSVGSNSEKEDSNSPASKVRAAKTSEGVQKKFKLKLGAVGAAVASATAPAAPSSPGKKEGDNG
ncbi:DUF625-domain-containing protein [Laetiporus sulphureus 93-53]|uniref:DUF625-domain-containing protein n=1 Tax=Laetiporus sulphureus 93-53 TaxID=1314785 RepID=A0A165E9B2_9APHY|nr:DUF625-domain-containing protein [Laetiporus sulphureus 93-53]KZT06517.1 DUF625-domain-containing protein [Laetiporus sulphureus 93-53]